MICEILHFIEAGNCISLHSISSGVLTSPISILSTILIDRVSKTLTTGPGPSEGRQVATNRTAESGGKGLSGMGGPYGVKPKPDLPNTAGTSTPIRTIPVLSLPSTEYQGPETVISGVLYSVQGLSLCTLYTVLSLLCRKVAPN